MKKQVFMVVSLLFVVSVSNVVGMFPKDEGDEGFKYRMRDNGGDINRPNVTNDAQNRELAVERDATAVISNLVRFQALRGQVVEQERQMAVVVEQLRNNIQKISDIEEKMEKVEQDHNAFVKSMNDKDSMKEELDQAKKDTAWCTVL